MRWDVSCSPDLSNLFISPRWSSARSLFHLLGGQLVAGLVRVVPQGTIWLHLCNHFLDNYSHFIWDACQSSSQGHAGGGSYIWAGILRVVGFLDVLNSPSPCRAIPWHCAPLCPFVSPCWASLFRDKQPKTLQGFLISVTCSLFSSGT